MSHRYQYGLWWKPDPRISTWSQVAAQTMDIYVLLRVTWTTDINVPTSCSRSIDQNVSLCGPQTTNVNLTTASLTLFQ